MMMIMLGSGACVIFSHDKSILVLGLSYHGLGFIKYSLHYKYNYNTTTFIIILKKNSQNGDPGIKLHYCYGFHFVDIINNTRKSE
jgi:hypothetical protein